MLQRVVVVAVSCNVLQCIAGAHTDVLRKKIMNTHCWVSVAVCGSVLQCVAERCNVLDLMFFARRLCIYTTDVYILKIYLGERAGHYC